MFKRSYYCLIAGLPDLFFSEYKTGIDSIAFRDELKKVLDETDYQLVKLLYLPSDNENLLTLLFQPENDFLPSGNFSGAYLNEQLTQRTNLPPYMIDFIHWVRINEVKTIFPDAKNKLLSLFYEFVLNDKNTFLHEWYSFELNIRNILTALNCRDFRYNTERQLVKTKNSLVYHLLSSNQLKPSLYEDDLSCAETIFRIDELDKSMAEKEKMVDMVKWEWIDEHTFFHYFTIEKILGFLLKLQIIERWNRLDVENGKLLLTKFLNELKTSYNFPAEFGLVK